MGRANVCSLKADTTDQFYNIGMGIQTTIKELTELIFEITGSDLKIQYEPSGMNLCSETESDPQKRRSLKLISRHHLDSEKV